jgi:hypothetical protein
MTSTIWAHTGEGVVIAADTAVTVKGDAGPVCVGHHSKLLPLAHVNAVFAGGGSVECKQLLELGVKDAPALSAGELRELLPSVLQREHGRYLERYGALLDLEDERDTACSVLLATTEGVFFYCDKDGFEEVPLGRGLYADPKLDGNIRVPGPFKGDRQIVHLMRRQKREADSWRYVGGKVVRVRIHKAGMSMATIGDLEDGK